MDELAGGAPQEGEILCSAEEYDYDSDSDLELIDDDPDSGDAAPMSSGSSEGRGLGRTVYIKDIAHKTLKSFAWYCYSGELIFAPFKSDTHDRKTSEPVEEPLAASKSPSCSPKSMYRLADKYGITELEDRTFEEIRDRLTVHNILDELFSTFTSRYDRVKQMEIDFICGKLDCPEISEGLPRVVAGFATDASRQPNFAVLSSLIQKLMERRSVPHYSRRGTNGLIMDDVYIPGERNERKVPADLFAF